MKIMCVGAARNCERTVEPTIAVIEAALPEEWEISWYVVESDSDDATVSVLQALSRSKSNFSYVTKGDLRHEISEWTERLAFCRNLYLDEAATTKPDLLLVADLDGVIKFFPDGLMETIVRDQSEWSAIFGNQNGPYYDLLALRHSSWNPGNPFDYMNFLMELGLSKRISAKKAIVEKMIRIPPSANRIPVDSAFGGIAIYRFSDLSPSMRYVGNEDGNPICEHVPLNLSLVAAGKRLFIEPKLQIARYTEHTYQLSPSNRLFSALMRVIFGPFSERAFETAVEKLAKFYLRIRKIS